MTTQVLGRLGEGSEPPVLHQHRGNDSGPQRVGDCERPDRAQDRDVRIKLGVDDPEGALRALLAVDPESEPGRPEAEDPSEDE